MLNDDMHTLEEVAKHLRVPEEAVQEEIEQRRLQAVVIGGHIRISESSLKAFKNGSLTSLPPIKVTAQPVSFGLTLENVYSFYHTWPDKKKEKFTDGQEGVAEYDGTNYHVKVGFTTRDSAGNLRRRSLVLINRYPSVEFAAADTNKDGTMASIIRDRSGKLLPVGATVPPEYLYLTVGPYRDIVVGRGAPNGLAVISSPDDLQTMVRHGVIRYRYREERDQKKEE